MGRGCSGPGEPQPCGKGSGSGCVSPLPPTLPSPACTSHRDPTAGWGWGPGTQGSLGGTLSDTGWEPEAAMKQELRARLPSATLVHEASPANCHKHSGCSKRRTI